MPITVGQLDNVPAPGDAIRSPWAQEISGYVVHPFASYAALTAGWSAPPNGSIAVTLDTGTLWIRRAGVWQALPNQTVASGGMRGGDNEITTGSPTTVLTVAPPPVPYPTVMTADVHFWFGLSTSAVVAKFDLVLSVNGSVMASPGDAISPVGHWDCVSLATTWAVPANAAAGFVGRATVVSFGGGANLWVGTYSVWTQHGG
jgi:hypothetical protein